MTPPARDPIELEPGTPLADALDRGRAAVARADVALADAAYRQAVGLAVGDTQLWPVLADDHVAALLQLRRPTLALQRCDEYVHQAGVNHVSLRVLRTEIRSSLGDHSGASAEAAAILSTLASQPDSLLPDEGARLHRVQGLATADRGDLDSAARHLGAARQIFLETGDQAGVAAIDRDLIRIAVWQGDEAAVSDVLSGQRPQTISDCLLLAIALKRQFRYQEAIQVLRQAAVDHDSDPALRWHVLYELILLLRMVRRDDAAQRLLPLMQEAAAVSADPAAAGEALARLSSGTAPSDVISPQLDRRVQHVRGLIARAEEDDPDGTTADLLDEAESTLVDLCPQARTDRDVSMWHLAAGELGLARYEFTGSRSFAQHAVDYLSTATDRAETAALIEVKAYALRRLGDACAELESDDRAVESWAQAHRLDEEIAGRQPTDDVRIGMLQAVPDEYDARIRAAAKTAKVTGERGLEGIAAVVVAMEAARGAMILKRILPSQAGLVRDLPRPSDLDGAWRWVCDIADGLPPAQVVWIMHSAPHRVHHAVMGRGLLRYASAASERHKLTDAIDAHMACWDSEELLELSITSGEFEDTLQEVAAQVGVSKVIPKLIPDHVRRIAIVAGDALSDIPFAAMTIAEGTEPIGLRFALSDLPCLSARRPLHRRSLRLRGDRRLLVSPSDQLTPAAGQHACRILDGAHATLAAMRAELELRRHHLVRIDAHGRHEPRDPARSWLQLAPVGPDGDGRLGPGELQRMDLSACGTVVLGACESGMAQRVARDERIGFVRAAVHAGAPAVIAARWRAEDTVAATVLNSFERYVRYLPRDLALQRAQLDAFRGAPGIPTDLPAVDHPARWACWTLYGDSGWQTGAGPVRRWMRHSVDRRRRRRAAHP